MEGPNPSPSFIPRGADLERGQVPFSPGPFFLAPLPRYISNWVSHLNGPTPFRSLGVLNSNSKVMSSPLHSQTCSSISAFLYMHSNQDIRLAPLSSHTCLPHHNSYQAGLMILTSKYALLSIFLASAKRLSHWFWQLGSCG